MSCPVLLSSLACSRPALGSVSVPHLRLESGSLTTLIGDPPGKSTLLWRLLGLLERPDSGEIFLGGTPTSQLAPHEVEHTRNRLCGYAFASPFLLPSLSLLENLAMPLFKLAHLDPDAARKRTEELLDFAGLSGSAHSKTQHLTPHDQWRASVARALAVQPCLLLVEHPENQLPPEFLPEASRFLADACARWNLAAVVSSSSPFPGANPLFLDGPDQTP